MGDKWRFRVRFSTGGSVVIDGVCPDWTLDELCEQIRNKAGDPMTRWIRVLNGFPPRPVLVHGSAKVRTFLQTGESLVVEVEQPEPNTMQGWKESTTERRVDRRRRQRSNAMEEDVWTERAWKGREEALDRLASGLQTAASKPMAALDQSLAAIRQDFRVALKEREEESKATHRLAAMLGGSARFESSNAFGNLLSGDPIGFRVEYRVGRQTATENHAVIPRPLLQGVIAHLLAAEDTKEGLKPFNLARQSPRMFWNLVRLAQADGLDLQGVIESLLPNQDFSFLNDRKRMLSERAMQSRENADAMTEIDREAEEAAVPTKKRKNQPS
mmetsp:Transcript_5570/g.11218  ORF Transcript_5570/g.11218 Transcript_5570/m.11218 type:complete len:328 (-) Transcript_5570:560-1543(-)